MAVFGSVDEANAAAVMDTVNAATKAGLTSQLVDDGHVLCAKPDSMELVDVFPDGSWEYQDVNDDGTMETMSGPSAVMLALYLSGDNKKLFAEQAE
jgi:hypothetical protein